MNAPVGKIAVDAVAVLIARAEARALLWHVGELDLHTAVDELWADAVRDGLVAKLGVDAVQRILADAFAPLRTDLPRDDDAVVPDPLDDGCTEDGVPIATLHAAEFLVRQRDAARMRAWLAKHTPQERKAILKHLEQRRGRK